MKSRSLIQGFAASIIGMCSMLSHATPYYVSVTGLNTNSGQTENSAWQTISYAASRARSGDVVNLKRGEVFYDTANLPGGVSLGAYGTAAQLPVISGAERISGWSAWPTNAAVSMATATHRIDNLYVNGRLMRIARYPNTGWLTTTTNDAASHVVTCANLAANPRNAANYWNGCRMRWRHWSWYYDTRIISSYAASGTMTLAGTPVQDVGNGAAGWGFYLDGKLSELDTAGEWFYDAANNRVYLYPPADVNLASAEVEGVWRDQGVSASNATIEDVCFRHYRMNGLAISGTTSVNACRFEGIGSDSGGASLSPTWGCSGVRIANCRFENNLNVAISWVQNPATTVASTVEHDTFVNTGAVPGYGGRGSWHAAGIILVVGRNIHIQYTVFDTTGYAAILLGAAGNFAEYNVIRRAMATLNDGAAIYTNCDSSTIRHNIITYSSGYLESSGWQISLAHGIWPEFLEHFKYNVIQDNTCAWCNGNGIFLPNNFHTSIKNNVCYANESGQMHIEGGFYTNDNLPLYDTITGNVFYSTNPAGYAITYRPEYSYGAIAGNYFCNPFRDDLIGQYDSAGWTVRAHTIAWWQTNWPQSDKQAKTDPIKRSPTAPPTDLRGTSRLVINDQAVQQAVALDNGIYRTLDNVEVRRSVDLAPYSSSVLVHTGQIAAASRPARESGLRPDQSPMIRAQAVIFPLPVIGGSARLTIVDSRGRLMRVISAQTGAWIAWDRTDGRGNAVVRGYYAGIVEVGSAGDARRHWYPVVLAH
jgi:hypothetical protein